LRTQSKFSANVDGYFLTIRKKKQSVCVDCTVT